MEEGLLDEGYIKDVKDIVEKKREKLLSRTRGSFKNHPKEYLSIFYSIELMLDVLFLNNMSGNKEFLPRYADFILRDILEQVVEYKYLMKNSYLIKSYVGANSQGISAENNVFEKFRAAASGRFPQGGRKSVSYMSKKIGENNLESNRLTLYGLYVILSEECHNSYYKSLLHIKKETQKGERRMALTKIQVMHLKFIVNSFIETFSNV